MTHRHTAVHGWLVTPMAFFETEKKTEHERQMTLAPLLCVPYLRLMQKLSSVQDPVGHVPTYTLSR